MSDLPCTAHAQNLYPAIDTKFMSTPQSTSSEQHIPNMLEKMLWRAANQVAWQIGHIYGTRFL